MSEYQQDLTIDKNALDYEWQRQPNLFQKYAEEAANANWERDQAKENIEIVKAGIHKEVSENPNVFGIEKVTVDAVKSAVTSHEKVKKAVKKFLRLKYEAEILMSAKQAFEHKKTALEHMAKLYLSGYWSSPRISNESKEEVRKEKTSGIAKSLNKNKRLKRRKLNGKK